MAILLTLLAFGTGFLVVFAVNMLFVDSFDAGRTQLRERLELELRSEQKNRAHASLDKKELYELAVAGSLDLSTHKTLQKRLELLVDQSGMRVKPERVVLFMLLGAGAAGVAGKMVLGWTGAIALGALGAAIPLAYVAYLRSRRLNKLQQQLPEVFELMSRMLRAGRTISQAFQTVGDEFPRPASEEFGYAYEQQNLGLSPEAAMRELARRTGLLELKIFVMAVMIHQQTGGNLADLLDKLSRILRDRFRIQGMLRAMTAEGRLQAFILLMLPPFLFMAISVINRPYAMILIEYPAMLVGMFTLMAIGALWMRRIISFNF